MKKKYITNNPEIVTPQKSLGQNFLVNDGVLNKIVVAAEIKKDDIILEAGPGTGNLTEKLAVNAQKVIAVEKDRRLISQLQKRFTRPPLVNGDVEIIEGDILKFNPESYFLKNRRYKIVANIPYYITSHFLRTVFEQWPRPELIVLMIQKEVAQRIMAKPPHTNLLALSVQLFANPQIIGSVSRGSFRPVPNVDSAIIKIIPKTDSETADNKKMLKVIRAGFSEKRKQLANNLAKNFDRTKEQIKNNLSFAGIKENARAENLSLEEWGKLAKLLES